MVCSFVNRFTKRTRSDVQNLVHCRLFSFVEFPQHPSPPHRKFDVLNWDQYFNQAQDMMTAKRKKEKPADNVIRCNMTPFPRSYGDPSGIPCDLSQQMLRTRKLLQQHIEKYAQKLSPSKTSSSKILCFLCVCVVFYSPLHFSVQNHFIFNHHVLATSMCRLLTRCILFYCSQDR